MLRGVAAAPAALLVVAADEGWMPQTREHVDVLLALRVPAVLVVVTRCDLADPTAALAQVAAELGRTALGTSPRLAVSARTGEGLAALRTAVVDLVRRVPPPRPDDAVRLWVDRSFAVAGSGTVVTGTLTAGRVSVGDRLELADGRPVRVRGLQSTGEQREEVVARARVALNLRGVAVADVPRGDALCTPGRQVRADVVDVVLTWPDDPAPLPTHLVLHLGTARTSVRVRPLGSGGPVRAARLHLDRPLLLRLGDVGLLRDPGRHQVVAGVRVVDLEPAVLQGRDAAARRGVELVELPPEPDASTELARRSPVRVDRLVALGLAPGEVAALSARDDVPTASGWLVDPAHADVLRRRAAEVVAAHHECHPLERGPTAEDVRHRLGLPVPGLVGAVLRAPVGGDHAAVVVRDGRVVPLAASDTLPDAVDVALRRLRDELAASPWTAPTGERLRELGLGGAELAAAVRTGRLERPAPDVHLLAGAVASAPGALARLAQPFTLAEARTGWGTSRRVALALLEHLDRAGTTRRLPDGSRVLVEPPPR